ncbi:hypothetical protein [Shewanella algae]|uniref:hypothetical protein n=1 Tax=Shewanella algae TaxID=38313 RepID=UPI0031F4F1D5
MTESNQLILKGTHGTSRYRADSILRSGFTGNPIGRHGTGTYFWASNEDGDHLEAIEMARCYAAERERTGVYEKDIDSSPRVLLCDIVTEHQSFVDVECREMSIPFKAFIKKMKAYLNNPKNGSEKERACKVADEFIAKIERLRGVKQDVIFAHAAAPRSYTGYLGRPERFLGMQKAGCYVVRSHHCIPLTDMQWVA